MVKMVCLINKIVAIAVCIYGSNNRQSRYVLAIDVVLIHKNNPFGTESTKATRFCDDGKPTQ